MTEFIFAAIHTVWLDKLYVKLAVSEIVCIHAFIIFYQTITI